MQALFLFIFINSISTRSTSPYFSYPATTCTGMCQRCWWLCAGLLKGSSGAVLQPLSVSLLVPRREQGEPLQNCRGLWLGSLEVAAKEMSPGAPAANASSLEKSCRGSLTGGSARKQHHRVRWNWLCTLVAFSQQGQECSYFLLGLLQGVEGFKHQRSCLCPGKLGIQHLGKRSDFYRMLS